VKKCPGPPLKHSLNPTFSQFLKTQINRPDRVGDFARDWVSDDEPRSDLSGAKFGKPRGAMPRFSPLRAYLERVGACENAIEAGQVAFDEWKKTGQGGQGATLVKPLSWNLTKLDRV